MTRIINTLQDIIRVYFWCQYVNNYNTSKIRDVVFPFIITTSLIALFLQGISLFLLEPVDLSIYIGSYAIYVSYGICIVLAAVVTYLTCLKENGYLKGEDYFRTVEEKQRRRYAMNFNAFFIFFCFSTRILFFIIGIVSRLI